MDKKFELTDETIVVDGRTLHRIKSLRDIEGTLVRKGDLGGFIEKEENLSHEGNCWIYNDACVYGDARVYGNAWVSGNAHVYDNARVSGKACVYGNAHISGNTWLYGNVHVYGNALVRDNARVYGNACVSGNARVYDNACVHHNARVYGYARVYCNAHISGNACVYGDANIKSLDDICYISSFGSENRSTTFFRCEDGSIKVKCGCFKGTLDEFRNKVKETHGDNKFAKEYLAIADVVELKFSE